MKLLVLTQKVDKNDPILGFFHRWLEELAKNCESLIVICLEKGEYDLPDNVRVLSLGKEVRHSKVRYIVLFYKYIWQERNNYDAVFVHMNQEYVVLGGVLWKLLGKKISLWYAHGYVNRLLRVAEKISDVIFTSTQEGFRIKSSKLRVVGQGIDTELFKSDYSKSNGVFKIVSVGRISPSKDYETLIEAVEILKTKDLEVEIAGSVVLDKDREYASHLERLINTKNLNSRIKFIGPISNTQLTEYLKSASLFVSMSHTGSLDKAILEGMSSGLVILTCNEALESVLGRYASLLMYPKKNSQILAEKIESVMVLDAQKTRKIAEDLRMIVVKNHNLKNLIAKISDSLKGSVMNTDEVKSKFESIVKVKSSGDYEYDRWFKTNLLKAGFDMTKQYIGKVVLPWASSYQNYLEIGPGPGTWTELFLMERPEARYTLVDISEEMLNLARENLSNHKNISFLRTDFSEFHSGDKFDFLFSSRALEYFPDKEKMVKKLSTLSSPKAYGAIITKMPHYKRRLGRKTSNLHFGQIAPKELRAILEDNGFEIEDISSVTVNFPGLKSARINILLSKFCTGKKLNWIRSLFTESYGIIFRKT